MRRFFPPAKINLGLRILGKRPDGFHELSSLIIPLPKLHDILEIEESNGNGLELECVCEAITGVNILQKSYDIFASRKAFFPSLRLRLEKRIPVGAGLGGGSSDAACLLRYMAAICPEPAAQEELMSMGKKIGADVPFFLFGKPAQIEGFGEIVNVLDNPLPSLHLVLVWPEIHISTKWAFDAYDRHKKDIPLSGPDEAKKNLTKRNVKATHSFPPQIQKTRDIISILHNDLEEPLFSYYPLLAGLRREFSENGALACAMSGSGSTMFGLFSDVEQARRAASRLRREYKATYQIST